MNWHYPLASTRARDSSSGCQSPVDKSRSPSIGNIPAYTTITTTSRRQLHTNSASSIPTASLCPYTQGHMTHELDLSVRCLDPNGHL